MEAYFDNSATTRCFDEVKDIVCKTMTGDFGNPSAMHKKGMEAENYVRKSAQTLAKLLKVNEKEILFTSGGTESDNLAIIGGVEANKRMGNHIITTAVEHAAVAQPFAYLKDQGYEVTILPVDHQGVVKLEALEAALRPDTILVSVMYVNNEVGAVMPVEEIGKLVHEKSPKALFHVDAIPGFRKVPYLSEKAGNRSFICKQSQDPRTKRRGLPLHQRKSKSTATDPWRRTAERHAFRNRQCTGNCRPWRCRRDGIYRF